MLRIELKHCCVRLMIGNRWMISCSGNHVASRTVTPMWYITSATQPVVISDMKVQFELTRLRPKQDAPDLTSVRTDIQANVLRLLNRQNCAKAAPRTVQTPCWLYVDPLSTKSLCWYLLYLLVFYIVQLQISMSVAFGPTFFQDQLQLASSYFPIYVAIVAFLAADVLLSLLRGYYAYGKGRIVEDPRSIVLHYLRGQLGLDVVSLGLYVVPLAYLQYGVNFLQLIPGVLFWVKKFQYQGQVQTMLQYHARVRTVFMIVVLFLDVLLVGNYGACIFIGIDLVLYRLQYYGQGASSPYYWLTDNTLYSQSLIEGPWYMQYIYGQAFSTGTLSTLAPGPFARNPWEIVYAIVVMILFMLLASYVAQVLIQIVYTHTEQRIFHEENIIAFDNLMQTKQVPKATRSRIYNFFELIWEVELKMETKQQEAMIHKLPAYLKHQLLLEIGFTRHIYFLEGFCSREQLTKMLSLKIQRSTIDSNTTIFHTQKPLALEQRKVFYIKQGMAKFYIPSATSSQNQQPEKILGLTNVEKVLGVYEFVTGQNYSMCCKSIDLCLIQTLKWSDFWATVCELQIEEQFYQMKHSVLYQRQLSHIKKLCIVCLACHLESECPDIYPKSKFVSGILTGEVHNQNNRKKRQRKGLRSRRQIAASYQNGGYQGSGYQNGSYQASGSVQSIFKWVGNMELGSLLLEMGKLDKSYECELERVTLYSSYYKKHNLSSHQ